MRAAPPILTRRSRQVMLFGGCFEAFSQQEMWLEAVGRSIEVTRMGWSRECSEKTTGDEKEDSVVVFNEVGKD